MNIPQNLDMGLLYKRVESMLTPMEWSLMAPVIEEIQTLKARHNAVILAHNYMRPEIFHGVSDITGDSLALAQRAVEIDADVIVVAGVHFMAETTKLLNPDRTVLIPDVLAGCSLAESITPEDIRALKKTWPGVPVCVYVNTSAAVKAEADICCTSGNAVRIVEAIARETGSDSVLFLPDRYLAAWVQTQTDVRIIPFDGACEVHEQYRPEDIHSIREDYGNDLVVIAHPECPPDVIDAADFAGSTAQMADYLDREKPGQVLLITECSMGDNLMKAHPETDFIRSCHMCPHMKRITLDNIAASLRTLEPRVDIPADLFLRARASLERMLAVGR